MQDSENGVSPLHQMEEEEALLLHYFSQIDAHLHLSTNLSPFLSLSILPPFLRPTPLHVHPPLPKPRGTKVPLLRAPQRVQQPALRVQKRDIDLCDTQPNPDCATCARSPRGGSRELPQV